jgi:regulator of protease activity HflC (stomatin/prohibitin superfamily)
VKHVLVAAMVCVGVLSAGCGIEQVNEGYRGVETKWGKVVGEPLTPGLYFYNPISTDINEFEVRERKLEGKTPSFTKDTQNVTVSYSVTLYPDPKRVNEIYSQFGWDWENRIVAQAVLGSLKDAIGRYIADELVSEREKCKEAAQKEIQQSLASRGILVTRLDFTNLDFDNAYESAVEAKVVAIQRAAEAKNKTVQVQEEANQKVKLAIADAEAMKIKTQALSQNKSLVQYEAVQKWNGALPQIMLGNQSLPILDLKTLGKSTEE